MLSAPGKAWDEIAERGRFKEVAPAFVYPLIGLCGLSTFIGAFVGKGMNADVFQVALTQCCAVAVALFGGFFLAAYLMGRLHMRWLRQRVDPDVMLTFVGYSMVVSAGPGYCQRTVVDCAAALDTSDLYVCGSI